MCVQQQVPETQTLDQVLSFWHMTLLSYTAFEPSAGDHLRASSYQGRSCITVPQHMCRISRGPLPQGRIELTSWITPFSRRVELVTSTSCAPRAGSLSVQRFILALRCGKLLGTRICTVLITVSHKSSTRTNAQLLVTDGNVLSVRVTT